MPFYQERPSSMRLDMFSVIILVQVFSTIQMFGCRCLPISAGNKADPAVVMWYCGYRCGNMDTNVTLTNLT